MVVGCIDKVVLSKGQVIQICSLVFSLSSVCAPFRGIKARGHETISKAVRNSTNN